MTICKQILRCYSSSARSQAVIENLLEKRFFYDQSFYLYGGLSGLYDLGPLGCLVQDNMLAEWKKHFVVNDNMHQVDCTILTPESVLRASGHMAKFADMMVKDVKTNESFRVDHLLKSEIQKHLKKGGKKVNADLVAELSETLNKIETGQLNNPSDIDSIIKKLNIKSPLTKNELTNATPFNLMFQSYIGTNENKKCYMRPETAQGIFLNFKRLFEFNHKRLPMAVAQIGKSFRNEINPKGGLIRQREFLMAEIEHFVDPALKYQEYEPFKTCHDIEVNLYTAQHQLGSKGTIKIALHEAINQNLIKSQTLAYYIGRTHLFAQRCGIDSNKIRFRQHLGDEMAHYANECWDLECETSQGWIECAGIADRCDYDLKQHQTHSGQKLEIQRPGGSIDQTFLPHVIEPSFGISRLMLTLFEHSFKKRDKGEKHYLSLPYAIAPYKCCILPLNESDEKFRPIVKDISKSLKENDIYHKVDDLSGAIGRRYWRADETGIPFAITLDYQTLETKSVTIRERDTTEQVRIKIDDLPEFFNQVSRQKLTWSQVKKSIKE